MTQERLVEKTRKLLAKWGVLGEEADKFITDLTDASEDDEVEVEEETTETIDAPEEEKVEEKEEVVEEETPTKELGEEETETTEEEEVVEEETETATEEAKEEVVEHEEEDVPKWDSVDARFTALDGEILELKNIINELRERVEGGAFGTTGKLPPQEDDEWEGVHTKAYFKNKRF